MILKNKTTHFLVSSMLWGIDSYNNCTDNYQFQFKKILYLPQILVNFFFYTLMDWKNLKQKSKLRKKRDPWWPYS